MTLSTTQLLRIQRKCLDKLAAHFVAQCMDDSEYIQIVRVLVGSAVSILVEDGESDSTIGSVEMCLREYARGFYVDYCASNHSEISNISDYKVECAELFDYIFEHGTYPD